MTKTVDIRIYGLELSVSGSYIAKDFGTYDTPSYGPVFEIGRVDYNGVDIHEVLVALDADMAEIERKCLDKIEF